MPIPPFGPTGVVPEGRHQCTLDEIELFLVSDAQFVASKTRVAIFSDLLSAMETIKAIDADLLERAWIGGGFASLSQDPSDIDVTFILNSQKYTALSRSQQNKVEKLCRHDGFKKHGLKVDAFCIVHELVANPWLGGGLASSAIDYANRRGAWDDWWSRQRVHGMKDQQPIVEDADTVRGYLEVILNG